jgi:dTDP-glucose pyrophosphorylase
MVRRRPALQLLTVPPDARLIDALQAVNDGGRAIAFVCDPGGRVLGTVTDGDARRAILRGASLTSRCLRTAMQRQFLSVSPRAERAEVLDLMRARQIEQIPVIDGRGRLVGLHWLHGLIGKVERENWAVIMAGGRGTRLGSLTDRLPKPMLPVAGRPILERLILHLVSHGFRRIALAVNYRAEVIEAHFGDGTRFGCRIEYLKETVPLGTAGALSLLPVRPKLPVLVINGDLVTQFDVARLMSFHDAGQYVATLGLRSHAVAIPFGVARVRGKRLVGLREKPTERILINAGIYVLAPEAVRMIPRGRAFQMTELFDRCLARARKVGAHLIQDDWLDIGRPAELIKARGEA